MARRVKAGRPKRKFENKHSQRAEGRRSSENGGQGRVRREKEKRKKARNMSRAENEESGLKRKKVPRETTIS